MTISSDITCPRLDPSKITVVRIIRPQTRQLCTDCEHFTGVSFEVESIARCSFVHRYPTGMVEHKPIGTLFPHASFGAPDCCGCLDVIIDDYSADIECNECGAVVRSARLDERQQTLGAMELSLEVASALCPHCGAAHLAPGVVRKNSVRPAESVGWL